ncbi:MAG: Ig-like domain-containing protein, partial [Wujia sp.]
MKKQSKKKLIAFLLSTLMLLSLFQNISYYPVAEGGEEPAVGVEVDGAVASESDAKQGQEYLSVGEPEQDVLVEDTQTVQADETKELLTDANVTLNEVTLKGVYKDETGTSHVVTFDKNSTISLPGNADINMYLDFSLVDGNSVTAGTKYVYTLPDSVRVDVEKTHELTDSEGTSIGQVHIARNGTLTFEFYTDIVANNNNIPFYVQFDGKFSESLSQGNTSTSISFPAGGATIDYNVDITEPTSTDPSESNLDYQLNKSGNSTTVTVNGQVKKAIHWSVEVNPRGRTPFSGTLTDLIPEGLTYVEGSFRASDYYEGTITPAYSDGILNAVMSDCKTYYTAKVEFDTLVEPNYGSSITNDTSITESNTASFNPDNTQDNPVSSNTATVTVKPNVLSKSGVNN